MEKTIKDVFNLIKKEILKDVYLKREEPEVFHFFRKNKRLQSKIIQDENILLLSIIYRFGDYGSISWNESENCKKIIKLHKIISKRGSKFYGISLYELGLLADELIEKNGKYSNLINNLKYCEHKYKESQSIENLKNLIIANMKLKRKSEISKHIRTIKKYYIKESSSIYVYLILKSRFFISLFDIPYNYKIKKSIVDKLDLEELIEIFEKKEEENELLGICDHVIFLETWIKILRLFFRKRSFEYKLFTIRNIKTINDIREFICHKMVIKNDEDFKKILYLTKKHDSILLKLVRISIKPFGLPIYQGTSLLIDRRLINLDFPDKYKYLLNVLRKSYHSSNYFSNSYSSSLTERLLIEFPAKKEETILEIASIEYQYSLNNKIKVENNINNLEKIFKKYEIRSSRKYLSFKVNFALYGKCIELLVKYYIFLGKIKTAKDITIKLINGEYTNEIEYSIKSIISNFYKAKMYTEFIELTKIIFKRVLYEKINFDIEIFFQRLAKIYALSKEKEKIDIILKYYENEKFDIDLQCTFYREEYESIKKIRNSI